MGLNRKTAGVSKTSLGRLVMVGWRWGGGGGGYLWRELPQVSFLSRENMSCRDKSMFAATKRLSQQAYFFRDKRRVLSRQK